MRISRISLIFISSLLLGILFSACLPEGKKKIVYINSYHNGHPSSDEIMEGFINNMPADSFEIYSYYMDTKRNTSKDYIQTKAAQLLDSVIKIQPDLLVVSDDNAVKYLVEPNLQKLNIPVVFCGVNWTDKDYNLPNNQVAGIIEILPVADAVQMLKSHYPSAKKLLVLNENTTTSRKEEQILDTLFQGFGLSTTFKLVDNFQEWKTAFSDGNTAFDIIYISTHAAIKGWDKNEAEEFIEARGESVCDSVFDKGLSVASGCVLGHQRCRAPYTGWSDETVIAMRDWLKKNYPEFVYPES